jgi:hypothetical protein
MSSSGQCTLQTCGRGGASPTLGISRHVDTSTNSTQTRYHEVDPIHSNRRNKPDFAASNAKLKSKVHLTLTSLMQESSVWPTTPPRQADGRNASTG